MTKKKLILIISVAVTAVVILIVSIFIVFKKPTSISECEDMKCIKNLALSADFNPEDCGQANQELKNNCYYLYETENSKVVKVNPGKYCGPIDDKNLEADCFYKTRGVVIMTSDRKKAFNNAVRSLDTNQCSHLIPEIRTNCIDVIKLTKRAVDEKNTSVCFDRTVDFPDEARQLCLYIAKEKLNLNNLINPTE